MIASITVFCYNTSMATNHSCDGIQIEMIAGEGTTSTTSTTSENQYYIEQLQIQNSFRAQIC